MNSLDYYGYAKLSYLASQYIAKNHHSQDGYSVFDSNGLPLFGLVVENKPTHNLEILKDIKYQY